MKNVIIQLKLDSFKGNNLFQVFECNKLNLIVILLAVISPYGFDLGNIGYYSSNHVVKMNIIIKRSKISV